ncbi:hypothetical protein [Virgibacillus proomii]|jgi:glucan phosphoethanolaminetransferase (alkaline phosphatase superfamily)|uniref:hypothetical protein n=1 Tax=Virgibacillus proomii TaxID=84407 RepID=UPI000986621F|nr:hypothetical protein [Virgibacillus proomii]
MYTYEGFEQFGTFTLLRPIFITFLAATIILLSLLLFERSKKYINAFTIFSLSILLIIASVQLMFYDAIITDELNLSGDTVSFFICLGVVGISLVNIVVYFKTKQSNR